MNFPQIMTTVHYSPFIRSGRQFALGQLRDINFALFRALRDSYEVKVINLTNSKTGMMRFDLGERWVLWCKSSAYLLRFEGKNISFSKAKNYAPQVSPNEIYYYCIHLLPKLYGLFNSSETGWYDLSTETEIKHQHCDSRFGIVDEIWNAKNDQEWPYTYNGKIFKSMTFVCQEQEAVFMDQVGMINRNDSKLGIAMSNEKINVLGEFAGELSRFEGYQWKIGDKMYFDYIFAMNGQTRYIEVPKVTIDVKKPEFISLYVEFVVVNGKEPRFISICHILISDDKIWEKILNDLATRVREIKKGYYQVKTCNDCNFVYGQQVTSQIYGRAVISSILVDIKGKFSGMILTIVGKTNVVIHHSELYPIY